jgi:hypothetical protein
MNYLNKLTSFPAFDGAVFHFGEDIVESLFRGEPPAAPLKGLVGAVSEAFQHFVDQSRFPDQVAFRFGEHSILVQAQPLHDDTAGTEARSAKPGKFLDHLFLTLCIRPGEAIAPLLKEGRKVLREAAKEAMAK